MLNNRVCFGFLFLLSLAVGCSSPGEQEGKDRLFQQIPADSSGIQFSNDLTYNESFNTYTYRNFYNGGGVGIADINNDGLPDIYFAGNMVPNKLYLNEGNFKFQDITKKAGVASPGVWSSGVSMADVNGDGYIDIYVCKSGRPGGKNRHNELFINNGDLTFTEKSKQYGLDAVGLSTQAAFFDYDRDGDLDLYLLNNPIRSVINYDQITGDDRKKRDPKGGNKLLRNDGDHFTDVSDEAGIYGSKIGFGLAVSISDINRDGWDDIYVSNDYKERDYLYINNHDGTFTESLEDHMREISLSSMGADIGDINNDGYPEIYVVDMRPEDEARLKTKTTFDTWNDFQTDARNGFYYQFTRNTLQLNHGPLPASANEEKLYFTEISRYAGVDATDWSWAPLIADLDNDGYKDIFVTNGIYKDLTDQDYVHKMADPRTIRHMMNGKDSVITKMIQKMPSEALSNYAFHNNGDLTFTNQSVKWGLGNPDFSNGASYADLDNDGDLDLVTNNVNMKASVYRNQSDQFHPNQHWLQLRMEGSGKNKLAIGAKVTLISGEKEFYDEMMPVRGFESSVDQRLHFGLGDVTQVDTLRVQWPDGRISFRTKVRTDTLLTLRENEMKKQNGPDPVYKKENRGSLIMTKASDPDWKHRENSFKDFERNPLLIKRLSTQGPRACSGDFNGDGRKDIYVGGAKGQAGVLFIQQPNGKFAESNQPALQANKISEDLGCAFLDANGDGHLDLYVASGGSEFPVSSSALADRLYLNDGEGHLIQSKDQILPAGRYESSSSVAASDFDGDGDTDLFVGIGLQPFSYGKQTGGYILSNDGSGHFKNVTPKIAPGLVKSGMITDGVWSDYDGDGDKDLLVVGRWMPIQIYKNDHGKFTEVSKQAGLKNTNGWWHVLEPGDFDGDGDMDYAVGGHGRNSMFQADSAHPVTLWVGDFDHNGITDQVISRYNSEVSYPVALRRNVIRRLAGLKSKYPTYASYGNQTMDDILTTAQRKKAAKLKVEKLGSVILWNQGNGTFKVKDLPISAQMAPVYAMQVLDVNRDGRDDLLTAGNFYGFKPWIGHYDASYGLLLEGSSDQQVKVVPASKSGFFVPGQTRDLVRFESGSKGMIWAVRNNDSLQAFEIN